MTPDFQVASLWIGEELSPIERMCIESYMRVGHKFVLFTYGDVKNVPEGVEIRDANEIFPTDRIIRHTGSGWYLVGSPAKHADRFRYLMLSKLDNTIWVDTDAYALHPHVPVDGHLHAYRGDDTVSNSVLALPRSSQTLKDLVRFTEDFYPIPPWLPEETQARLRRRKERGKSCLNRVPAFCNMGAACADIFPAPERRNRIFPATRGPVPDRKSQASAARIADGGVHLGQDHLDSLEYRMVKIKTARTSRWNATAGLDPSRAFRSPWNSGAGRVAGQQEGRKP